MLDEKAQMHTLEGVAAAAIMLLVIVYAIDATSMTPLTSSTANVHVETELQALGQDILGSLDYSEPGNESELKNFIANWDGNSYYVWNGSAYANSSGGQLDGNSTIVKILNQTLVRQGIAHNLVLTFLVLNADNTTSPSNPTKLIYNGDPSDNAVIVSRKIVLHYGDINTTKFPNNPIENIDPSTNLYNIVEVKLILWRM
jgi:hypothetical protein